MNIEHSTMASSMMGLMEAYDEDLSQNSFLVQLQDNCPQLYETTANNRWMICVPRSVTSAPRDYSERDFLNHILIQLEHRPGAYKTLSDKEVVIEGNVINTGQGFPEERFVPILFEETFFNVNDESYRVLCVNQMLEGGPINTVISEDGSTVILRSLGDCVELLWGRSGSQQSRKHLDELIDLFNKACSHLEGESLQHQVDAANALFSRAMQIVLKDSCLKKMTKNNIFYLDNVKLAVETYVTHGVYRKLFKNITTSVSSEDAQLNKITRNLSELQLKDLGVRQEFFQNIPRARRELSNMNRYSTPMGKLNCIKRVVKTLMEPPKNGTKEEVGMPLTTDDLLPILVFLVVKLGMANWWANFYYMTTCRFSKTSNDDEFGFYLASLEAALEHVSSGQLGKVNVFAENTKNIQIPMSPGAGSLWQRSDSSDSNSDLLFQCVRDNDLNGVEDLLNAKRQTWTDIQVELCHPLCSCDKCETKLNQARTDPKAVTAYTRDDRGYTVLHVAALFGHTDMTDFLVSKGAVVNATDYHGQTPLHISCQKGHQGVTLLLLHHKASVNLQDTDKNTALHLAASNGHEDCVKALVYYDQGSTSLNMDIGNDFGDTPLHMAAKWGYENIVEILLENGATADIRNRKKQTPANCAHNLKVSRLLLRAQSRQEDQVNNSPPLSRSRRSSLTGWLTQSLPVSQSCPDLAKSVGNNPKQTPPSSGHSTLPRAVAAAKKKKQPLTEVQKKIEKLLKAVADGDMEMVKFHLGLTDDDLDDDLEERPLSPSDLCHPLCQCPKCKPLQRLTRVNSSGIHINCANSEGFTPLHVAAMHGHETLLELFLKRGANVNERNNTQECTALHLACQNNKPQSITLLLQHKAKVNAKDVRGNTALHYCCLNANHNCAQILLKNGANANQANYKGNTPLHEAARWNAVMMTQLLLRYGAVVNMRNRQQLTPVQLAQNDQILKMLCEAGVKQTKRARKGSRSMSANDSLLNQASLPTSQTITQSYQGLLSKSDAKSTITIQELFAAFEEEDLRQLQDIVSAVQSFDREGRLRHAITRDRSAPRLDWLLQHQLSIQHFDPSTLRPTETCETVKPVVITFDGLDSDEEVELERFSGGEECQDGKMINEKQGKCLKQATEKQDDLTREKQSYQDQYREMHEIAYKGVSSETVSVKEREMSVLYKSKLGKEMWQKKHIEDSPGLSDSGIQVTEGFETLFEEDPEIEDLFASSKKSVGKLQRVGAAKIPGLVKSLQLEADSEAESENSNTESHEDWELEVT